MHYSTTIALAATTLVGLVNGHGHVNGIRNNGVWTAGQDPS